MQRITTCFALFAALLTLHVTGMAENVKATFFVAPNGDDEWSGKLAEPDGMRTDGPFATLGRARDAVRELKDKRAPSSPITVMVRGGKYYLEHSVVFGPEDSGSREFPITYKAYPGEKPVLSGGRTISGWKPYKGKILKAQIPEAKGGKWKFRSLFFNDQRQTRARYPNLDPQNPIYGGWAFMEGYGYTDGERLGVITYRRGTFPHHWTKPQEGEVNMFVEANWHNDFVPIKAVDEQSRTITLTRRTRWGIDVAPGAIHEPLVAPLASWWGMKTRGAPGARFRVENLLEELDQPGEWCLDSDEGIVYFWPPDDSLEQQEVVAPLLNRLIDLQGAS